MPTEQPSVVSSGIHGSVGLALVNFVSQFHPMYFFSFIGSVSLALVNLVSHFSPRVFLYLHRLREVDAGEFLGLFLARGTPLVSSAP